MSVESKRGIPGEGRDSFSGQQEPYVDRKDPGFRGVQLTPERRSQLNSGLEAIKQARTVEELRQAADTFVAHGEWPDDRDQLLQELLDLSSDFGGNRVGNVASDGKPQYVEEDWGLLSQVGDALREKANELMWRGDEEGSAA